MLLSLILIYLQVYENRTLTAKAHILTHYGAQIRKHGPLSQYWCMRFEGKHRLAKLVASVSCEFALRIKSTIVCIIFETVF